MTISSTMCIFNAVNISDCNLIILTLHITTEMIAVMSIRAYAKCVL